MSEYTVVSLQYDWINSQPHQRHLMRHTQVLVGPTEAFWFVCLFLFLQTEYEIFTFYLIQIVLSL